MQAIIEFENGELDTLVGLQGFGREIAERILPDTSFRVIGCCLANGYGFWVDSFASRAEAEQEVESWPEGEFSLSLIVEAS